MALNSGAPAAVLVTILTGLDDMGSVQIGAPASIGTRVSAWVSLGSQRTLRKATGVVQRETRYLCMLVYRVDNTNESTAETTLMALVDDFMDALHADLTLGGTVLALEAHSLAADEPDYQLRAGKEYREYPIVVVTTQQGTYEVNP